MDTIMVTVLLVDGRPDTVSGEQLSETGGVLQWFCVGLGMSSDCQATQVLGHDWPAREGSVAASVMGGT